MYIYEFTSKSLKQLKKIDKQTQRLLLGKIDFYCKQEMFLTSEHLTDKKIGSYRFRIGDYRIIFDIDGKMITILSIGHRRDIYR